MHNDLYRKTSLILNNIFHKRISIKSAIYNDTNIVQDRNFRKIYKLVNEIVKNRTILEEICDNFYSDLEIRNKELFCVFLYEYFISQQAKQIGGKLMKQIKQKSEEVKKYLKSKEFTNSQPGKKSTYLENTKISFRINSSKLDKTGISIDEIIKEINLQKHEVKYNELYLVDKQKINLSSLFNFSDKGFIIFQNESSFLPVHILSSIITLREFQKNVEVIDSCSAPGNKTLQLADYFSDGKITAFEKDKGRFQTLTKRVNLYNSRKNILTRCEDFLSVNPLDYPETRVVLCDPSCSGSGTLNNAKADDNTIECCLEIAGSEKEKQQTERLKNLSKFQEKIVLHAMSFPNVKFVSYSTCSVYITENEFVVSRILKKNTQFKLVNLSSLNLPFHQGIVEGYENCVRTCSKCHGIDGFFIAIFEKNE